MELNKGVNLPHIFVIDKVVQSRETSKMMNFRKLVRHLLVHIAVLDIEPSKSETRQSTTKLNSSLESLRQLELLC